VTAAAVLLIILAVVPMLIALALFVGAGFAHRVNGEFEGSGFAGLGDAIAGIAVAFGVVALAYGIVKLIAGIKVLGGSNGWRVTGIVFSALGAAFWVLSLIGSINGNENNNGFSNVDTGPNAGGIAFSLVFLALNVVTIVLLAKSGPWFRALSGGPPAQQWPQQGQFPPPGQYQG
jgi:hypothetical protein